MILLLCDVDDAAGPWLAAGLRRRLPGPVVVVTGTELTHLRGLDHEMGDAGTSVRLLLSGGRVVDGREVTGVLNRLTALPPVQTPGISTADRGYAWQELSAITLSWLAGLAASGVPFVGTPDPNGLSGPWRRWAQWCVLAAAAGVPVRPWSNAAGRSGTTTRTSAPRRPVARRAVVLAGEAYGPAPPDVAAAATGLAAIADATTLEAGFDAEGHLTDVPAVADLRLGGEPLLDHLGSLLGVPA